MKKSIFILLLISSFSVSYSRSKVSVKFNNTGVYVQVSGGAAAFPGFTQGLHGLDSPLAFMKAGETYWATLPIANRGLGAFRVPGEGGDVMVVNLSELPVPRNLQDSLTVDIEIPIGKFLAYHGRIWTSGKATVAYHDYFVAREFPIILFPPSNYVRRVSRLNRVDSLNVVYVWTDSLSRTSLSKAFSEMDDAADYFGQLIPSYIHKNIIAYDGAGMQPVVIINNRLITGLEHANAPYMLIVGAFITADAFIHSFLHCAIGEGARPAEYMRADGHYEASDALAFYEGLTTFLAMRQVKKDFSAHLSAQLYRAKLESDCVDLTKISICGQKNEKWYAAGYAYWINLAAQGLNVELFTKFLYSIELINQPFPYLMRWSNVLHWLTVYDPRIGRIAAESYQGSYLKSAFDSLEAKGWQPIPVWQVPRWYDHYIGPYPVIPDGIRLPTDDDLPPTVFPKYLVNADGSKMPIDSSRNNPALEFIKSHPDSSFQIEFSDGETRIVPNKLKFSDGSPYFMHGAINPKDLIFWRRLNAYLR